MASKRKSDAETPPLNMKKRRTQTFRTDYTDLWPFLKPGDKGQSFAFCTVCKCDFSVAFVSAFVKFGSGKLCCY